MCAVQATETHMTPAVSYVDRRLSSDWRARIVRHLTFWASPFLAAVVQACIIRRDERLLQAMPDHELKDIGIARSEIAWAVRLGRLEGGAEPRRGPT